MIAWWTASAISKKARFYASSHLKNQEVVLIPIKDLKEHEQIEEKTKEDLKEFLLGSGVLPKPIIVDRNTNVIIDGHHRFNIFRELGKERIPVFFVDYRDENIVVLSPTVKGITKDDVIEMGNNGKRFGPKTTRHFVRNGGGLVHISMYSPVINYSMRSRYDRK